MPSKRVELLYIDTACAADQQHSMVFGFRQKKHSYQLVYIGLPGHPGLSVTAVHTVYDPYTNDTCNCANFIDSVRNRIWSHLRDVVTLKVYKGSSLSATSWVADAHSKSIRRMSRKQGL